MLRQPLNKYAKGDSWQSQQAYDNLETKAMLAMMSAQNGLTEQSPSYVYLCHNRNCQNQQTVETNNSLLLFFKLQQITNVPLHTLF